TRWLDQFKDCFGHRAQRVSLRQYVDGLLGDSARKSMSAMLARVTEPTSYQAFQHFITHAPWHAETLWRRLRRVLPERTGILILDETSFPKQGTHSVGVARQYCGALGKVANCQLGVFLAYVSARGHALVNARLYLPPAWIADPARCRAAGVPEGVGYQSTADLALDMLRQARAAGHLQGHWVAGDDAYGMVPTLRDALDAEGWTYVLDVPQTTPVFIQPAPTAIPPW